MKYKIIIKTDIIDRPKDHEIKVALIVANKYFKSDVTFLRQATYSTPDIEVCGKKWEIKSPCGNGKKTIENNLRSARKQSKYIIIDFSRMKLHQTKALSNIRFYLKNDSSRFRQVIVITKDKKIFDRYEGHYSGAYRPRLAHGAPVFRTRPLRTLHMINRKPAVAA